MLTTPLVLGMICIAVLMMIMIIIMGVKIIALCYCCHTIGRAEDQNYDMTPTGIF